MTRAQYLIILLAGLGLTGCVVRSTGPAVPPPGLPPPEMYQEPYAEVYVSNAPPPPMVEYPTPMPGPGYVWIDGYWDWTGYDWFWLHGYWSPPRPGYVYVGPRYVFVSGRHVYHPGYWHDHQGRRDYHYARPAPPPRFRSAPPPRGASHLAPPAPRQAPAPLRQAPPPRGSNQLAPPASRQAPAPSHQAPAPARPNSFAPPAPSAGFNAPSRSSAHSISEGLNRVGRAGSTPPSNAGSGRAAPSPAPRSSASPAGGSRNTPVNAPPPRRGR